GFLLDALEYGAPPHGGVAFGLDRIVMLLAENSNFVITIYFQKMQLHLVFFRIPPAMEMNRNLKNYSIRSLCLYEEINTLKKPSDCNRNQAAFNMLFSHLKYLVNSIRMALSYLLKVSVFVHSK